MLRVPKSLLTARSWTRRRGAQNAAGMRGAAAGGSEPGPSPLLPPCPSPGRAGRAAVNTGHVRNKAALGLPGRPERECGCHRPPSVQALQAGLNPQPPQAGHAIYNAFNISLFSANNTCSKFKSKAYFALLDDLRPSHDLLHCYRC